MSTYQCLEPDFSGVDRTNPFRFTDGILRDRERYFADIFEGNQVGKSILLLTGIIVTLTFAYGFVMGGLSGMTLQVFSSAIKVPLLYILTLAVCYPVLYVVGVIMGSRLRFLQMYALILVAIAFNAILLASCAPIILFFTLTGADYNFLKLLHVLIFGGSGIWGMYGLWTGLEAMCEGSSIYPRQAFKILKIWIVVFALIGTQMAWSLRPFIGDPELPFVLFSQDKTTNIYQDVWRAGSELAIPRMNF
ncbi:MAG: actin-binding WH2 domain-containing protein [Candidatus Omnitrophica bacterium]|nr:actin-binding WH2 domain-containing protein [Candidatus Omnitrophota bacterium]MCB9783351.1 actin-binding WH2 domain-containing protein [Candidatus Omnitrophota bacterium]